MNVLDHPLYAVTVTAAARVNTPMLLLHWHSFHRATPLRLPGVPIPTRAVPGSAIQINEPWQAFESIDQALLDAAWQLGAWDLERLQRRASNEIGTSAHEALACHQAFGDHADDPSRQAHLVDETPDREGLMRLGPPRAICAGHSCPSREGAGARRTDEDDTLETDSGRRRLPCLVAARPVTEGRSGRAERVITMIHFVTFSL
jgi:hypothetical protein